MGAPPPPPELRLGPAVQEEQQQQQSESAATESEATATVDTTATATIPMNNTRNNEDAAALMSLQTQNQNQNQNATTVAAAADEVDAPQQQPQQQQVPQGNCGFVSHSRHGGFRQLSPQPQPQPPMELEVASDTNTNTNTPPPPPQINYHCHLSTNNNNSNNNSNSRTSSSSMSTGNGSTATGAGGGGNDSSLGSLLSAGSSSRPSTPRRQQQEDQQLQEDRQPQEQQPAQFHNGNQNQDQNQSPNNKWGDFPNSEAEARVQLEECFRNDHSHSGSSSSSSSSSSNALPEDLEFACDVLREYPGLARQLFADAHGNGYHPFVHAMQMMEALHQQQQATQSHQQQHQQQHQQNNNHNYNQDDTKFISNALLIGVHDLFPEVLLVPQGKNFSLPLHIACSMPRRPPQLQLQPQQQLSWDNNTNSSDDYNNRNNNNNNSSNSNSNKTDPDEVIPWLIRKSSSALEVANGQGMLPIHCLLARHMIYGGERATYQMIRYLVEFCPRCVLFATAATRRTCLDFCFHGGYDIFVLNYILGKLPAPLPQFLIATTFLGKPVLLDQNKAHLLEHIIRNQQVQYLECEPAECTQESLQYLMACLQDLKAKSPIGSTATGSCCPALNRMHLKVPSSSLLLLSSNSNGRFAFQQALRDNNTLFRISLTGSTGNTNDNDNNGESESNDSSQDSSLLLESLRLGLAANRTLHTLQLSQFKGRLHDLVVCQGQSSLRCLEFHHLEFTDNNKNDDDNDDDDNQDDGGAVSSLVDEPSLQSYSQNMQSIRLFSCTISPQGLTTLLRGLAMLPSLQDLILDLFGTDTARQANNHNNNTAQLHLQPDTATSSDANNPATVASFNPAEIQQPYDMTVPLVAIIAKGRLKTLSIGSYPLVQVGPVCEELKQNTSLQYLNAPCMFADDYSIKEAKLLDVLALHNTHLTQVKTHTVNEKITHFTTLNQCGRTKARDEATSRSEFVELLCSVAMWSAVTGSSTGAGMEDANSIQMKHSLVFGLLRESPNQWSKLSTSSSSSSSSRRGAPTKGKKVNVLSLSPKSSVARKRRRPDAAVSA